MQGETLTVYNHAKQQIGTASRSDIHSKGLWHETFHCWILDDTEKEPMLYLQLRSKLKKDFPSLYDITAAGHLLSHENTENGVREVQEELGISLSFSELHFIGQFRCVPHYTRRTDQEFASTYVHLANVPLTEFTLQTEEVAGIVRVPFDDFFSLCFKKKRAMPAKGFIEENGIRKAYAASITLEDVVPHSMAFLQQVALGINELISERKEGYDATVANI